MRRAGRMLLGPAPCLRATRPGHAPTGLHPRTTPVGPCYGPAGVHAPATSLPSPAQVLREEHNQATGAGKPSGRGGCSGASGTGERGERRATLAGPVCRRLPGARGPWDDTASCGRQLPSPAGWSTPRGCGHSSAAGDLGASPGGGCRRQGPSWTGAQQQQQQQQVKRWTPGSSLPQPLGHR